MLCTCGLLILVIVFNLKWPLWSIQTGHHLELGGVTFSNKFPSVMCRKTFLGIYIGCYCPPEVSLPGDFAIRSSPVCHEGYEYEQCPGKVCLRDQIFATMVTIISFGC